MLRNSVCPSCRFGRLKSATLSYRRYPILLCNNNVPRSSYQSVWAGVMAATAKLGANDVPPITQSDHSFPDAIKVVGPEMDLLTANIRKLLKTTDPTLGKIAQYYFQVTGGGKRFRPLLVLTLSRAIPVAESLKNNQSEISLQDKPLSPMEVLGDDTGPITSSSTWIDDHELNPEIAKLIMPSQRRMAEITEMIHAASLLHDDVIDGAMTRRGRESGNAAFGNKLAILAGDFLLGRASIALARLRNPEVIELLATVIANLVEGEFLQLKNIVNNNKTATLEECFDHYLRKTYLKTASLMSKSCRATALLAGAETNVVDAAYQFGRNIGLAFQIVDDLLDFTAKDGILGKPTGADLELGLATAPVLFAWERYPQLGPLIKRQFSQAGDVEQVKKILTLK